MKILALDLSTKSTGSAWGQDGKLLGHTCVTASSTKVEKRIQKMRDEIQKIVQEQKIDKIIAEDVRPEQNSHTQRVLMWLQGQVIIAAVAVNPKLQYQFYTASQWRKPLGIHQGRGVTRNQLKPQDIQYVKNKYSIDVNDDEADAIGILDAYWIKNHSDEINFE